MRWKEVVQEMPLNNLHMVGDMKQPGSFDHNDRKAFQNTKWQNKVDRMFAKCPWHFNIVLYNGTQLEVVSWDSKNSVTIDLSHEDMTVINTGQIGKKTFDNIEAKVPNSQDCINVLMTNNRGGEVMAMTPWILVHRICHALIENSSDRKIKQVTDVGTLYAVANNLSNHPAFELNGKEIIGLQPDLQAVIPKIATVKSLKAGNWSSAFEIIVEFMTQFIVQGQVTLTTHIENIDSQAVNLINNYQKCLNFMSEYVLDHSVGKFFTV